MDERTLTRRDALRLLGLTAAATTLRFSAGGLGASHPRVGA